MSPTLSTKYFGSSSGANYDHNTFKAHLKTWVSFWFAEEFSFGDENFDSLFLKY